MKFFHLSDLHIGLKLYNRDLYEDQKYIFGQICNLARKEQPDAIVIAGDIYDKAIPSAEAVAVFDDFTASLRAAVPNAQIMMISGNHDSGPRINVFRGILKSQNVHMIGLPPQAPEDKIECVTMRDEFGPVNFYLLPFVKHSMVKAIVGTDENGNNLSYNDSVHALLNREKIDTLQRNVLVSHQFYLPMGKNANDVDRMDSEIRTVGNIDEVKADILERFDYAALGHIHKPMKVGSGFYRYCGTPIACSVSEAEQQKGVLMVEMKEKGSITVKNLPLTPMHPVRILKGSLEEILMVPSEDYVTVILTAKEDLDVLDMQDRLRSSFPNLLEIRRDVERRADYSLPKMAAEDQDPFSLCCSFLKDLDDEEKVLLRDVINTAREDRL